MSHFQNVNITAQKLQAAQELNTSERVAHEMLKMYMKKDNATFQTVLSLMAVMLEDGRCSSGEKVDRFLALNGDKILGDKIKKKAATKDQVKKVMGTVVKSTAKEESTTRTQQDNATNSSNRRRNVSQDTT